MKYKNIFLAVFTCLLFVVIGCVAAEARFAPNGVQYDRQAVIYEAHYAAFGIPYTPYKIPDNWNYLASTAGTYWHTIAKWQGTYPVDGWMTDATDPVMRKYFIKGDLPSYGRYKGILRGGQCKYFANYVLYNAGVSGVDPMPSYETMDKNKKSSAYARPGDVLFRKKYHTAIVYSVIKGDSEAGTVTSVGVIDSNYIGGSGNERIAYHKMSGSELASYGVWTGVSYYNY